MMDKDNGKMMGKNNGKMMDKDNDKNDTIKGNQDAAEEDIAESVCEEGDFDENAFDEDAFDENAFDEDDFDKEEGVAFKPWMIPVFSGMLILAILICIPLWGLTHRNRNAGTMGNRADTATEDVKDMLAEAEQESGTEQKPVVEQAAGTEQKSVGEQAAGAEQKPVGEQAAGTGQKPVGEQAAGTGQKPGKEQATGTETLPEVKPDTGIGQGKNPADESAAGSQTNGAGQHDQSDDTAAAPDPISGNASMSFQEVNDSVTAKDVTNLRSLPSTENAENVVGQLKNGENLTRTGINSDTGWSRLTFQGETVYAVSRYLTTDLNYKPPVSPANPNRVSTLDGRVIIFADCDDYVTPKEYVNLRTEPSTSEGQSTVRCQVNNGEKMHRTGHSADSGWSRVEYNGEKLYVVSSLLQGVSEE